MNHTPDNVTEPSLAEMIRDIWEARTAITRGFLSGALCALLLMGLLMPSYKAEMIVAPASPMNGADMSSMPLDGSLSALRYLVQRAGGGNSSNFLRFENLYAGPSVATLLLKDDVILAGLQNDKTLRLRLLQKEKEWTPDKLSAYIERRVKLVRLEDRTLRRLTYLHPDRKFAPYLLSRLHILTDALIRNDIRGQTIERISYLQEKLAQSTNPEHRRALATLLLEQERLLMLASIDQPYAAAALEPPHASVKTVWPDPLLVFPIFMLLGAVLGLVFHSLCNINRRSRGAQTSLENFANEHPPFRSKGWFKTNSLNTNQKSASHDKPLDKPRASNTSK